MGVDGGGCSGFQYDIRLDDAGRRTIWCWNRTAQKVLVDPVSLPFLANAVIDFTDELIGARFVVRKPQRHRLLRLRHQLFDLIALGNFA